MALTRKFLSALGIEAEKVDEIIQAHSETVEALKEERDSYKENAEKAEKLQKELDSTKNKLAELSKEDAYKVKYDALKEDYDKFKKGIETEKIKHEKTEAFRKLLKEVGISEKRIDAVLKVSGSNIDALEFEEDGKIKGIDELKKAIASEWADFIVTDDGKKGADVSNPPANNGGKVRTKEEIMKIKDVAERQQAMLENKELFIK